jgi:hypothetical protein
VARNPPSPDWTMLLNCLALLDRGVTPPPALSRLVACIHAMQHPKEWFRFENLIVEAGEPRMFKIN